MAGLLDTNIPFDATAFEKKYPNLTSGAYPKYMGPQLQPRGLLQTGNNSDIDKLEAEDIAAAIRQEGLDKNVFNNDMEYVNSLQQFATEPESIVKKAINDGAKARGNVNAQNEQLGFMDKIFNNPLLQRMMERSLYAVPTMGGNFVSEQASGERGLRSMEAQEAEREAKLKAERLKAGDGRPKKDKQMIEQINRYAKSKGGVDILNRMKSLTPGGVGGVTVVAKQFIDDVGKIFELNPSLEPAARIQALRSLMYEQFSFVGREMSKSDKEIINKMIPEVGGVLLSNNEFLNSIAILKRKFEAEATISGSILRKEYGRDPNSYIQKQKQKVSVTSRKAS